CPRPPSIANGLHSGHSSATFSRGLSVSYSCREGFQLLGNVSITCTDSGRWSRPLPRCEEVTCPRPPSIANGLHSGHSSATFSRGLSVSYSCREGFQLLGNVSITCTDSGRWSRPLPRCEGLG
ncbi:DAF factor, partial [Prunella fulvescens]|nr:DAF factor [Prunella fulvescens]